MRTLNRRTAVAVATAALSTAMLSALGGSAAAQPGHELLSAFSAVDRGTTWNLADSTRLNFTTYHPQGMAVTADRIFTSSVQILEPTEKFPEPVDGLDRTTGRGVGHLFVTDLAGNLQADVLLGEGDAYHPGGIDVASDGWLYVPVAQYRPNSHSVLYRVNAQTLEVQRLFEVDDHVGGLLRDETTGNLVGNTWGSRTWIEWTPEGQEISRWENPDQFVDYQDCQYAGELDGAGVALCGGVAGLAPAPGSTDQSAPYQLGGLALVDLRSHAIVHQVPFQQFSAVGNVATRNPVDVAVVGDQLVVRAAPDDGEAGRYTDLLTYTTPLSDLLD